METRPIHRTPSPFLKFSDLSFIFLTVTNFGIAYQNTETIKQKCNSFGGPSGSLQVMVLALRRLTNLSADDPVRIKPNTRKCILPYLCARLRHPFGWNATSIYTNAKKAIPQSPTPTL